MSSQNIADRSVEITSDPSAQTDHYGTTESGTELAVDQPSTNEKMQGIIENHSETAIHQMIEAGIEFFFS
jgi:hypothetical protein